MYGTGDFKKGLRILLNNEPYSIIDFEHFKPGKGNQFTRTKLKNLITGTNLDKTFKSGEKVAIPDVEYQDFSFLYKDTSFHFMNESSYEQISLSSELLGENQNYLLEGMRVKACLFNEKVVSIELPVTLNLKVKYTEPGFKGNTVSGGATKPATLETGLVVQVPLHIKEGDCLKIDTRTSAYIEKAKKDET